MSETRDIIKQIHKELDDMTPAENLVVAEDIIGELHVINDSLREEKAKLRDKAIGIAEKHLSEIAENERLRAYTRELLKKWKKKQGELEADNAKLREVDKIHTRLVGDFNVENLRLEAENAKLREVIATVEKQEAILTVGCCGCGRQVPGNPNDLTSYYCVTCARDKGAAIS